MWTMNLQMFKLDLEKAEEPEIKLLTSVGSWKKQEISRKTVQFSPVARSCLTLCNPMDCSTPGFLVHHQLPEFTQTHVQWVGDAIQPSHPLSSPSLPTFNLFQHQHLFRWMKSGQSIGVSASTSVLPVNIQDWFPLGWTGWISLQSKGLSKGSSPAPQFKSINSSALSFLYSQLSHPYMTTGKTIALTRQAFVDKVMFLLFNMLSYLVMTFLPRSKCLLISRLQSPFAVILEPPKIKSVTVSIVSPSICHEVMDPDAMILVFWMLSFKSKFSLSSFSFIKRLFRRKTSTSALLTMPKPLNVWITTNWGEFFKQWEY